MTKRRFYGYESTKSLQHVKLNVNLDYNADVLQIKQAFASLLRTVIKTTKNDDGK